MKKTIPVFLLLISFLLSGCSSLLESERLVTRQYEREDSTESGLSGTEISNYAALRSAVKWLVDNHVEAGELTFSNYDGDISDDLSRACEDVKSNTAIGAYCVEYMSHPIPRQIVSYYRADLNITYKRTKQEVDDSIALEGGINGLPDAIGLMLRNTETLAAYRVFSSSLSVSDVEDIVREAYMKNILSCPVMPAVTVNVYPDSGLERIFEISLNYGYTKENLDVMKDELRTALRDVFSLFVDHEAAEAAIGSARRLSEICVPEAVFAADAPPDDTLPAEAFQHISPPRNTAVSAMSRGVADSEGFALAYYIILRGLGINCEVVSGALDRKPHFWNIVQIDGAYYHFDTSLTSSVGLESTCLRRDEDMSGRYYWDMEGYPVCEGSLTYYDVLPSPYETGLDTQA